MVFNNKPYLYLVYILAPTARTKRVIKGFQNASDEGASEFFLRNIYKLCTFCVFSLKYARYESRLSVIHALFQPYLALARLLLSLALTLNLVSSPVF